MAKRPLLVVGAGAIVITALEGIACGNPVAPRGKLQRVEVPADAASDAAPASQTPDAGSTAADDDAAAEAAKP